MTSNLLAQCRAALRYLFVAFFRLTIAAMLAAIATHAGSTPMPSVRSTTTYHTVTIDGLRI